MATGDAARAVTTTRGWGLPAAGRAGPHVLRDRALGHLRPGGEGGQPRVERVDLLAGDRARQLHQRGAQLLERHLAVVVADEELAHVRRADDFGQPALLLA